MGGRVSPLSPALSPAPATCRTDVERRVTPIQFLGYAITLFFFVLYNVFQFHPELGERLWEKWSGRR